ncbi:MAG: sigma 54-interacting transcriptional regulator [Acidobacteriota bacterium]|nr:sigma 54-interacting transcriptional regulator [Acidobacteriota bacterium]
MTGSRTKVRVDGFSISEDCGITLASLERGVVIDLAQAAVLLLHYHEESSDGIPSLLDKLGYSRRLDNLKLEAARLAGTWSTVLICGEFGTEKRRLAEIIHQLSEREGPFVAVNLAEMMPGEATLRLFGDPRAAYPDPGSFGRAAEGTLYLDEIDQADDELQELLMTFMQTGIVPGREGPRAINLRLMAGTAAPAEVVKAGGRSVPHLLHGLGNVLALPPLRERRDDISSLFMSYVRQALAGHDQADRLQFNDNYQDRWLPKGFLSRLVLYRWPGNLDQLKNVAEQLVADSLGRNQARLTPTLERMF